MSPALADLYGDADPVAELAGLDRASWLELRREGIGGSDAAAIVGMSPYATSIDVWLDKTGQADEWDGNERTRWGQRLEDAIADGLAEDAGLELHRPEHVLAHPELPYVQANPDRFGWDDDLGPGVVEIKNADRRMADYWHGDQDDGDVPDWYALQVHHYLAATGHRWGVIAVLLGGNELRWRRVDRDEDVVAILLDAYRDFWQHVRDGTPPPVTGPADAAKASLGSFYQPATDDAVDVDDLADALADALRAKDEAKRLGDEAEAALNLVRERLGYASVGLLAGVPAVTWKAQTKRTLDRSLVAAALGITADELLDRYSTTATTRVLRPKKKVILP